MLLSTSYYRRWYGVNFLTYRAGNIKMSFITFFIATTTIGLGIIFIYSGYLAYQEQGRRIIALNYSLESSDKLFQNVKFILPQTEKIIHISGDAGGGAMDQSLVQLNVN